MTFLNSKILVQFVDVAFQIDIRDPVDDLAASTLPSTSGRWHGR
jgi:hypothetical protein